MRRAVHRARAADRYILNDGIPHAMAVNTLVLDVVAACNAIYLSSELPANLNRDEIRAVHLHELALFHGCMHDDTRTKRSICLCLSFALAPIALLPDIAWIEWRRSPPCCSRSSFCSEAPSMIAPSATSSSSATSSRRFAWVISRW
jgi:hypothetical protein